MHETMPLAQARAADPVARLVYFYETLTPQSLAQLEDIYAPQAWFTDPFNRVQGRRQIRALFEHMFATLLDPHFVVTGQVVQGGQCFLIWDMRFRFSNDPLERVRNIHGCTHLCFDAAGLVTDHRDYWDAAGELYEQLPWLGPAARWLRRRMAAAQHTP